jgi:GTP-binding protein
LTAQDTHIAGYIHEVARGIVIVVNKWDLVRERRQAVEAAARQADEAAAALEAALDAQARGEEDRRVAPSAPVVLAAPQPIGEDPLDATGFLREVRERIKFMPYAPVVFAAAKTGYHVGPILDHALRIFDGRQVRVPTAALNDAVREAVQRHSPPTSQGRALKVYYATQAEVSPPTFVFFVNDPSLNHFSYERYLENRLREAFGFEGTAIRLQFRPRPQQEGESARGGKRKPARGRPQHR